MIKEYHLHLDDDDCLTDYCATQIEINLGNSETVIHSTQPTFLSFDVAEELYVHYFGEVYQITLGKCEGTNRIITKEDCLYKLLFVGEFDWCN